MPWQVVVLIRIFVANVINKIFTKIVVQKPAREVHLVIQYGFCVLFSVTYFLVRGAGFHSLLLVALGVGIVNGFACYCSWRADAISMSKAAAISIPDDIIALALAHAFLNETIFISKELSIGVLMCVVAAFFFAFHHSKLENGLRDRENIQLIKWVLLFTVIWGVEVFMMRGFALRAMPAHEFLIAYYGGSGISAIIIFLTKNTGNIITVRKKEIINVGFLATAVWSSQLLLYWSLQLEQLPIIKPIFTVSAIIVPMIVGWIDLDKVKKLRFKNINRQALIGCIESEAKNLSPLEKSAFLLGCAGGFLIAFTS